MSEEQAATATAPAAQAAPAGLYFDDVQAKADRETLKSNLEKQKTLGAGTIPIAPIGGQLISSVGGVVGFTPMGGNPNATGAPNIVPEFAGTNPPAWAQTNYLNCMRWQYQAVPFFDDVTQAFAWAQAMNLVILGGRFQVEVINDKRYTPAMLAKFGLINGAGLSPNLGCRMTLLHGNAANYAAYGVEPNGPLITPDFYYCPRVLLANPGTVVDAINKKMVRSMPMELVAGAPVFHMPYEQAALAAYLNHLNNIFEGF